MSFRPDAGRPRAARGGLAQCSPRRIHLDHQHQCLRDPLRLGHPGRRPSKASVTRSVRTGPAAGPGKGGCWFSTPSLRMRQQRSPPSSWHRDDRWTCVTCSLPASWMRSRPYWPHVMCGTSTIPLSHWSTHGKKVRRNRSKGVGIVSPLAVEQSVLRRPSRPGRCPGFPIPTHTLPEQQSVVDPHRAPPRGERM